MTAARRESSFSSDRRGAPPATTNRCDSLSAKVWWVLFVKEQNPIQHLVPFCRLELRPQWASRHETKLTDLARCEVTGIGIVIRKGMAFERTAGCDVQLPDGLTGHAVASGVGGESKCEGLALEFAADEGAHRDKTLPPRHTAQVLGHVSRRPPQDHFAAARQTRHCPSKVQVHGFIAGIEIPDS